MNRLNIKRFAGSDWAWDTYELRNIKRDGSGNLIQADVYATLCTFGNSIDTIYEIDANGNTSWATDTWTIEAESGTRTTMHKRYNFDTSDIKGIEVHNWSNNYVNTLYFHFTVVDSDKTTYLTKTGDTAVLHGNVLNDLSTYDWNNAPSIAAVRNYLSSGSFVHTTDIENIVADALLAAHPIGSIETNVSGTNPGNYLGGTWKAFGAGRVLMGIGTGTDTNSTSRTYSSAESTGGEYTHQLTVAEMPSHKHPIPYRTNTNVTTGSSGQWTTDPGTSTGSSDSQAVAVGGNGYHNNIQPYITVYFWKRVS